VSCHVDRPFVVGVGKLFYGSRSLLSRDPMREKMMRLSRVLAIVLLVVILPLSVAQNAFAATVLAYDNGIWWDYYSLGVGGLLAVRFTLSDFVSWPQASVVRVAFYVLEEGMETFRVHIRGNLGTACDGSDLASFDVTPYVPDWNYYDVGGGVVVSGEFCVLAEWLTVNGPMIGLASQASGSGHSYIYQNGVWSAVGDLYDHMIRAYVDPTAPVGGFIEPANKPVVFAPWLAVIGLVGCIGTAVVVVKKRRA
jgi:hypothetical protein